MSPQLLRDTTPTARKQHRCSSCRGPINVGEKYSRATLIYDEAIYDWLDCPACVADSITNRVYDWSNSADGVTHEGAYEWAVEQVIHGNPDDQRAAKAWLERAGVDQ